MNKILILSTIVFSNLILLYSCNTISTTNIAQPVSTPTVSSSNDIISTFTSTPISTPTPTSTLSPYTDSCLSITDTGKKFSIKCQRLVMMSGKILEKGSTKGLKSKIKFENSKGSFTLDTDENGIYEISNFGPPDKFDEAIGISEYNFKITISSKGYLDLNKELTYKSDSSLTLENPINFELEKIRII